jgi:hypothetical protein
MNAGFLGGNFQENSISKSANITISSSQNTLKPGSHTIERLYNLRLGLKNA